MSLQVQKLLESLNDALIAVDGNAIIQFVSRRFTAIFGHTNAVGRNLDFLVVVPGAGDGSDAIQSLLSKPLSVAHVRHASQQTGNQASSLIRCVVQIMSVPASSLTILMLTPVVLPSLYDFSFKATSKAALSTKLSVDDVNFNGRRVLIRVDFNVPIDAASGKVRDDNRIRQTLPTIRKVLDDGAKTIVLMSHLGRPKGKRVEKASLRPVASALSTLLGRSVTFAPDALAAHDLVKNAPNGEIILLENVRFHPGEDDKALAGRHRMASILAQYGDIYVSDAFGTCHRESASMTGVPRIMGAGIAGYLIEKEVSFMSRVLMNPVGPFVAIVGGSKVSDKISLLGSIFNVATTVIIGGAMAFTFLEALGCSMGASKVERTAKVQLRSVDLILAAKELIERARQLRVELLLPLDHACAAKFENVAEPIITPSRDIPEGLMGLDVGPKTIAAWSAAVAKAKTLVWNGPVGVFEFPSFARGTNALASAVPLPPKCLSVAGGGDTAAAVKKFRNHFAHVSTGGGATLELLEGKALPGLVCLSTKVSSSKL